MEGRPPEGSQSHHGVFLQHPLPVPVELQQQYGSYHQPITMTSTPYPSVPTCTSTSFENHVPMIHDASILNLKNVGNFSNETLMNPETSAENRTGYQTTILNHSISVEHIAQYNVEANMADSTVVNAAEQMYTEDISRSENHPTSTEVNPDKISNIAKTTETFPKTDTITLPCSQASSPNVMKSSVDSTATESERVAETNQSETSWTDEPASDPKAENSTGRSSETLVSIDEARLGLLKVIVYLEAHPIIAPGYVPGLWQLFKLIENSIESSQGGIEDGHNAEDYVSTQGLGIVKQEENLSSLHERIKQMLAGVTNMTPAPEENIGVDIYSISEACGLSLTPGDKKIVKPTRGAGKRKSKRSSVIRNRPMTYAESDEDLPAGDEVYVPPMKYEAEDEGKEESVAEESFDHDDEDIVPVYPIMKRRGRRPKHKNGHKCLVCNKIFRNASHLRDHAITHTDDKPYRCETCGKGFRRQSYIKQHEMLHTGERPYSCDQCDKGFRSTSELRQHQVSHSGEKPHECGECGATFVHATGLKSHMRIHTGERPYSCKKCGISLAHAGSLKIHMMRAHTKEKPFVCAECGKAFTTAADLRTHQKIHTGERPYGCTQCSKRFSQCGQLKTHMRTHTGEKPYLCTECGKGFAHTSSLSVHMRGHTGERPYHCTLCDKKCTDSTNLKKHMRLHTGEKTHLCSVCGQSFQQASSLHKHMVSHTPPPMTSTAQSYPTTQPEVPSVESHHINTTSHASHHGDMGQPLPAGTAIQYQDHMQMMAGYMATNPHLYEQHMNIPPHLYTTHTVTHHHQ